MELFRPPAHHFDVQAKPQGFAAGQGDVDAAHGCVKHCFRGFDFVFGHFQQNSIVDLVDDPEMQVVLAAVFDHQFERNQAGVGHRALDLVLSPRLFIRGF